MKHISILLISMCLSLGAFAAPSIQAPAFILTQETVINLGTIASITCSDERLEKTLRSLSLGTFPAGDSEFSIKADSIRVRLDMAGVSRQRVTVDIPEVITLVRSLTELQKRSAHQRPPTVLAPTRVAVQKKKQTVAKLTPQQPTGISRGVMLKTSISAGEIITTNDVMYTTFRRPRIGLVADVAAVLGKRALRNLRHKTILKPEMVGAFDVIQGDRVRVQAKRKNFVVEASASAGENGMKGEVITVFNPRTRKNFSARITGPGLVEVLF